MKLHSILTTAALASFVTFLAGLALNFAASAFLVSSMVLLLVLIGLTDYGARRSHSARIVARLHPRERMPLAA